MDAVSVHHLSYVLRHPDELPYHGSTLLVLVMLADRAGDDDRCWPRVELLASEGRMSRATVFRALEQLESDDVVSHERQGRSSVYTLSIGLKMRPVAKCDPSQDETSDVSNCDPPFRRDHESSGIEQSASKNGGAAHPISKAETARKSTDALEKERQKQGGRHASRSRAAAANAPSSTPRPARKTSAERVAEAMALLKAKDDRDH